MMRKHIPDSVQINTKANSALAKPRYPSGEYKTIFEMLLIGTFALVCTLTVLLFVSYFILNNSQVIGRIFMCGTALLYLAITQRAWARRHFTAASMLLILFYFGGATLMMLAQGIDTTFAQLMLAITIVLSGMLLGARYALYAGSLSIVAMLVVQVLAQSGSSISGQVTTSSQQFGDILGFSALLGILALISWLFGKRSGELLALNKHANAILEREKGMLELRVREHSEQLRSKQLEEIEQLYKFAEVGQLSAMLLHDIANHLAVLNLDLADLRQQKQSKALRQLSENIGYIEQAIGQARRQLQAKDNKRTFSVVDCINDSVTLPRFKASSSAIHVEADEEDIELYGESLRLSHVITILVSNALESYKPGTPNTQRHVSINIKNIGDQIVIAVLDRGQGIPASVRENLFAPLNSNKKDGLGIGLFIAKKVVETHFNGTLSLGESTKKQTEFILELPKERL